MKIRKRKLITQIISAVVAVLMVTCLGTAALASSEPMGEPSGEPAPFQQTEQAPGDIPQGEPGGDFQPQGEPSGEPDGGFQPQSEPSGEPDGGFQPQGEPSGEMSQPSGEPGASGEPGMAGRQNGGFEIRNFLMDIVNKILEFFGFGGQLQESPSFEMGASSEMGSEGGMSQPAGGMSQSQASGEMGASGEPASYAAANTLTADDANGSFTSANGDENAVLVSGSTLTLRGATVNKTGSSSGDSADFYGVNAGILAIRGANLTITDADVTTDGTHANGVFSYGTGTTVNISDSTITTSADNSGGIMTTGGGTMNARNLTVSTSGNSSAAIRSDRGGGTVTVDSGSYATSGVGSPAIYSTADISVTGATLTSSASEAVVIEGGNSVTLTNSDISGNNSRLNGQSTMNTNVLIYQSMSGDAAEGNSTFTMTGGTMTAGTGAMFHVTNVTTEINLSGVDFSYASDSDVFLDASSDAWGTAGRNGGSVTLNLDDQDITGVITQDSNSSVAVNLSNGSTWTLTGDSYVSSLSGDTSGIDLNGHTLYVNGTAWNG